MRAKIASVLSADGMARSITMQTESLRASHNWLTNVQNLPQLSLTEWELNPVY